MYSTPCRRSASGSSRPDPYASTIAHFIIVVVPPLPPMNSGRGYRWPRWRRASSPALRYSLITPGLRSGPCPSLGCHWLA
jgi:hypothetical protein